MRTTVTIDVGTTSVKLALFDPSGSVRASTSVRTPTVRDAWGEVYDLPALTGSITRFIGGLEPDERRLVERIAITGVGESGGLVRSDLSLASPMILWHDQRGADRISRLEPPERLRIYEVTGLPANANYGLSKAAWAVDHAEGDAGDVRWLNIAEYLAAVLTGERWAEYTLASRTMALDLRDATWSDEVCALLGVDPGIFPALRSANAGLPILSDIAQQIGIPAEVRVHVAGHDHMVGAVGADLHRDELLNSTGTTEGLLVTRDAPTLGSAAAATKLANGICSAGTDYTLFASIPTGGSAFATLQDLLGTSAEQLTSTVLAAHDRYLAGAVDLDALPLVLPQFRGSPPPTKDATARGAVSGISSETTAADLVIGCFLGMVLQFADVLTLFDTRPASMKVIGPAARNPLWLQLKADLLDVPLSVSSFPEVVSRGAQALASDERPAWDGTSPREVSPDRRRADRLGDWRERVRPRWEHLKAMPA